jgi:hypothetical protein
VRSRFTIAYSYTRVTLLTPTGEKIEAHKRIHFPSMLIPPLTNLVRRNRTEQRGLGSSGQQLLGSAPQFNKDQFLLTII